jgi:Flp pilus assembly pilin Flp
MPTMNKLANVSKLRKLAKDTRGATMVEYALMLFLILVVAAIAIKTLGKTTTKAVDEANTSFS